VEAPTESVRGEPAGGHERVGSGSPSSMGRGTEQKLEGLGASWCGVRGSRCSTDAEDAEERRGTGGFAWTRNGTRSERERYLCDISSPAP